jgi:hypothetical protein
LQTGKPFKNFSDMRSREILANWLICAVQNATYRTERLTFTSDPTGGDGVFHDTETEETWPSEHVMVPYRPTNEGLDAGALILNAVALKQKKGGAAYANGKTLVVFLNAGAGVWYPNRVAKQLPQPLDFGSVWVVGLHGVEAGEYTYNVTLLDVSVGDAPAWRVRLSETFHLWKVERIQ